jgi:hypothetical protein
MAQEQPWVRAIKRVLGNDAGYVGLVEIPANKTYTVDLYVPVSKQIKQIWAKTSAGTLTLAVQKNGVDITGLTAFAVTNVRASQSPTSPYNGTNDLSLGDVLTLIVTANAAGADLSFGIIASAR